MYKKMYILEWVKVNKLNRGKKEGFFSCKEEKERIVVSLWECDWFYYDVSCKWVKNFWVFISFLRISKLKLFIWLGELLV